MTVKSILEIDVNDDSFVKFQAAFAKYQSGLGKQPEAWAKVNKAIKDAKTPFSALGATISETTKGIKNAATFQQKFNIAAQGGSKAMQGMAKGSLTMAKNITKATLSLMKWASLTGLFSGLIGGGSLFGIDRLAASAANSRRQSQGLGISPGDLKSAQVNFGKFVDVDSALESVANTRSDLSKRWIYSSMGVDPNKGSNVDVMAASMKAAKHIFENNGMTQQGAQAHGLTELFGMDDLRRMHAMTDQEIDAQVKKQQADKQSLEVSDEAQKSWQDLTIQLSRAGAQIENVLTKNLVKLAGPISNFSDSLVKAFNEFANSPKIGEWIDSLGKSIEQFAKYVASDEFKTDITEFIDNVKQVGDALYKAFVFLKIIKPKSDLTSHKDGAADAFAESQSTKKKETYHPAWWNFNGAFDDKYQQSLKNNQSASGKITYPPSVGAGVTSAPSSFSDLESKYNLPNGILDATWKTESGRGKNMLGPITRSGERAKGHFQFMPTIAKEFGIAGRENDLGASSDAAARKIRGLMKQFNGDIDKAMASYNWGEGNVKKDIAKNGDKWKEHLPAKTRNYIDKVVSPEMRAASTQQVQTSGRTIVEIRNNTGGNAIVSTNALAY